MRRELGALQVEALSKRDRLGEIRARPAASASLRDTKGGTSADDARERGGCRIRLIVWCVPFGEPHGFAGCRNCRYRFEPATASLRAAEGGTSADPAAKLLTEPSQMASPAEMARRYGPETPVPEWQPDNPLAVKVAARNIPLYRQRPRV